MRLAFIIILFLVGDFVNEVSAEDARCHRSTEGKEFWFGFMEGRNDNGNVHYIEITVTASEASNFKIYIGKSTVPLTNVATSVGANSSVQINIPLSLGEAKGSETIQEKGIYLVAEKPVNVYALNWDRNSADVAVIYPVPSLGKQYYTMCFEPNVHNRPAHGRNSEFLIVASEDSTTVAITPSVVTDGGRAAREMFTITLDKGEVYQVQSLNQRNLAGQGDLTGSYIESDKPVAVYSGNFSTTVPAETGMSGYDHLFEQMPPLQTWGREYFAVPLLTRRADRYRVMASDDSTLVSIGTNNHLIIERGQYHEFTLGYDQPTRIYANKPIMVAQFSQSNRTDEYYTGGEGDPFMIILGPVSQSKNEATFVAYDSHEINDYYVNIVVLTSEKDNIELDGEPLGFFFKPFAGTNYSYTQHKIYSGTHTLKNLNPDRGFLAYVYGYGGYESYGYGVGFNLDLVLDIGQGLNFDGDTLAICEGQFIVLDAGPYFDSYFWNNGETTQKITVDKEGKYRATGTTTDGCLQHDSIYILVSTMEKPNIGGDSEGCAPYEITLNAGSGYEKYEWNTGGSTQIITANTTGLHTVVVYDRYGCHKSDTMNLTVFPVPTISMVGDNISCGSKSRTIDLQFDGADENMLANGKMEWQSNDPDLTFSNKTNTSTEIKVSGWGDYKVSTMFTTPDGCIVNNTFDLRFADTPTSKIEFADENPNDKCGGYSREIKYTGNATPNAIFFWDFDGANADSIAWDLRRVSLGVFASSPVVSLVVEENGCWSDTTWLAIGANPDFEMNTTKSRGCDSATMYFSGKLKTPDDLRFEWDFGDGSPISDLQNPTHFYADTGQYNVGLIITNQLSGCKIGFTIDEMVKIFPTPKAEIAVDPDFCNDKTVEVFYLQNIDSSFCTWDFDGASQIGAGNDSITVLLENPIATIRLQVEEYGCKSEWAEASAKRKPLFDFATDLTVGCQPLQILAKAHTLDENIGFKWLTDSIEIPGVEQNFLLPHARKYGFSLAANSASTGCSDTILKSDLVEVHPKPLATFDVDYPVAIIEHANLQFTNQTTGVETFFWDFGDGLTSSEENPRHTFTELGKFPVNLIVESGFGCLDTAAMDIEILPFDIYTPNAFRPGSDIPENREFMPVSTGVDPDTFKMQIFNRWGEVIFETSSLANKWDGTTKNNNPAPMGNYIWKAEFNDIQGFKHSMKGQILLIR
jgi:gliding motility-associated-like protein